MVGIPDGEKKFEDIFIRFGATRERDGRTDTGDGIYRAYASHRAAKMWFVSVTLLCGFNVSKGLNALEK